MPVITIGTTDYEVYETLINAELYFAARLGSDTWDASDINTKNRTLVTSARLLDRQLWQGVKTVDAQPIDWPRTGVVDAEGNDVETATIPQDILDGYYEMGLALISDVEVTNNSTTGSNIQRLKAGEAEAWFFRPTLEKSRIPFPVLEILGQYLGAAASFSFGFVSGCEETSSFDAEDRPELLKGFF